jgi:hypothetical protein
MLVVIQGRGRIVTCGARDRSTVRVSPERLGGRTDRRTERTPSSPADAFWMLTQPSKRGIKFGECFVVGSSYPRRRFASPAAEPAFRDAVGEPEVER